MEFTDLEKYRELRKQFEDETGDHWTNSQGEPDIDYVSWLEQKLVKESDSLPCVSDRFDDEKFIGNVCISYRHDYGLLDGADKDLLRSECKEWMRAIKNNAPYGR
jgi:hypothetical protein